MFGIAYRMLGSVAEAEDIVQEAWIRWQAADRAAVRDPAAFLTTMTTRLAITATQSARARRETYVGPWLPEPVDTSADPALGAERNEALEFAVLQLLERLKPTERAAYVLRQAFDYSYAQIADMLQVSEANARQLASRSRKHLSVERRAQVGVGEQRRLMEAFIAAAQTGDVGALEQLFVEDIVSVSDGGGVGFAGRKPVIGRARVVNFIATVWKKYWTDAKITWVDANGRPAFLMENPGLLYFITVHAGPAGIDKIMWVANPAKLAAIAASKD
jgi:RNA polymerase sigma-70 factor (ECF subfamily)